MQDANGQGEVELRRVRPIGRIPYGAIETIVSPWDNEHMLACVTKGDA